MTTIKRTSICLILLVFSTLNSSAQSVLQKQYRELQATLSDYEVVRLIPSDIEAQVKEGTAPLELNLKGETFRFRMEPRDLRSPRYRAEATGPDGVRRPLPLDEVTTYRGMTVSGQEVVQGRFTIDGDRFEGVVFTSGDWTFIESLQHFTSAARGDEWVVYRQSDIQPGQGWRCGVSHRLQEGRDRLEARAAATDTTTTYKVEVATEADYEYVQHWGSAEAANREIRTVLNQVEGVYEDELKLKLEIVYQHAWNRSSDPYSGTDGSELLDQFREYWNDNFSAEGYDLAHLWTDRETLKGEDKDGEEINLGGIAWRAEVCKRSYGSWSYGLTKRQYYRSSGIIITAHEIGHNFSAVHPNHEDPPVTSCDATIMQSGWDPPKTLTFCQFSRNEIRSHVSTYNSCLEAETETITLRPPSNVTAEALGPHRVQISWRNTNGENSHGYSINRREPGGRWKLLVYQFKPSQEFIDGSVGPESTYSYRMYAYNTQKDNIDSSSWSRTVTATTPAVPVVEDPTLLTSNRHIPHIAQGQGWSTWIYVLNTCSRPVTYDMDFFGEDGRRKSFAFRGDDEKRYNGIYNGEEPMDGKDIRLYIFPDTGSELLQGFGHLIDNGEGCVSVDTEYRQMRPDGEVLFSTVPLQRMTTDGLVFALSGSSCSLGVAIAGTGEHVRIEAVDYDGNSMGSANLGNVYHTAFALKDKLPRLRDTGGQLRIVGEAAAVGLEFCDGELAQFRLPHYVPPGSN